MKDPKMGFEVLRQKYHALITALVPHQMWEITLPVLERTTYAQTGLILSRGPKFDSLTDNGTTNNGNAFRHSSEISRKLHRLMIKDNVALSGNEYYTCHFIAGSSQIMVEHVNQMVDFMTSLDLIMKQHA